MNKYVLLASVSAALLAAAPAQAAASKVSFEPIAAPTSDAEKRKVIASPAVTIDGKKISTQYHVIARGGDKLGHGTFGLLFDQNGKPVMDKDGKPEVSVSADFHSLLPVGDKLYMVGHWESRPAAQYVTELKQDKKTGLLTAVKTQNIDYKEWGGLWVPCAGSVTPWNTHLGSEEYPPDARLVENAKSMDDIKDYYKPMARYFGMNPADLKIDTFKSAFNPYKYGFANEITVDAKGNAKAVKHYAMGRVAFELAYVMPDKKTVFATDDGTNDGFYMFIADKAGDLTAGNLYAMKWHQTSADNGGAADLSWVALGHADFASVKKGIDQGVKFSDLFETGKADKKTGMCEGDFKAINTETGFECLKVKKGMDMLASRLETRRYASLKGATTEMRKEEGITFDAKRNKLYMAMSNVARGMEDNMKKGKANSKYDIGGHNDVRLPYNKCGTVYEMNVAADSKVGSDFVPQNIKGLVEGKMTKYTEGPFADKNKCDIDGIAEPDNVTMFGDDVLIIGEDTGSGHQNDAIWAFDLNSKKLTRILTTPYGSETTSPYFYRDINGFSYLMTVVQHPYGESDQDQAKSEADKRAYVGYVGPFPAFK